MSAVLLLGFAMPTAEVESVFEIDSFPAIQTHRFAWSFAGALRCAFGEVVLASTMPIQNFPVGKKIFFSGGRFEERAFRGIRLPFINILGLKHFTRFFATLILVPNLTRRHKVASIFIHGVHSPFLLFGLAARLFRHNVIVVLTDPPGVEVSTDGMVSRWLKRLDRRSVEWALGRFTGVIALSPGLVERYCGNLPALVVPGIVEDVLAGGSSEVGSERVKGPVFTIAYAGGLHAAYGVDALVAAIHQMERNDIRLVLYGRGDQQLEIEKLAAEDHRIDYKGFVTGPELFRELREADLLINPRPTETFVSHHSFPSKLIEYLAMGRPVLTTRIPGIPLELADKFFFIDDESVKGIQSAILKIQALDSSALESHCRMARRFILLHSGQNAVGEKIRAFLLSVDHKLAKVDRESGGK